MGYYTDIRVIESPSRPVDEVARSLNNFIDLRRENPGNHYHPINTEPYKWYERAVDLQAFTTEQPDIYFVLLGMGENFDDTWLCFVGDGYVYPIQFNSIKINYPDWWPNTNNALMQSPVRWPS